MLKNIYVCTRINYNCVTCEKFLLFRSKFFKFLVLCVTILGFVGQNLVKILGLLGENLVKFFLSQNLSVFR